MNHFNRNRKSFSILRLIQLLILLFIGNDAVHCADDPLPRAVTDVLKKYHIPLQAVSLQVKRLDHTESVLSVNPKKSMNPASVMKLVTTLAALEILGPAYTWKTRYFLDGNLKDGNLDGNLVLKGGGDPYLTTEQFLLQLSTLRSRGLQNIEGDLIIDDSSFVVQHEDRALFDGEPERVYNVIPNASIVNFSSTRVRLVPQNDALRIFVEPPASNLKVVNQIKPSAGPCRGVQNGWAYRVKSDMHGKLLDFHGKYSRNCGETELTRSFLPNPDYTFGVFKKLWEQFGGRLDGKARHDWSPVDAKFFLEFESRPLTDVITGTNKFSNNVMARQLLLTIGRHLYGEPGTPEKGIRGIQEWLRSERISMPDLVIENGSGLSRIARVSADSLSHLLQHAWASSYQPEFLSSLAIASIDGTMQKRLRKESPAGRVRIKTGLLNQTRAMAGYVSGLEGKQYSVAMLMNHPKVNYWSGNQVQDALLRWLMTR